MIPRAIIFDLDGALVERGTRAPVPGVLTFIVELSERGIPKAVATGASPRSVRQFLEGLGLTDHFPVVVTADDVSRGKPDPEVYLTAADRLGVAPESCLVFEDSLAGISAALAAGMSCVGLTTAHTEAELKGAGAACVIRDFEGITWDRITR
jgi:beta-phosphoglucomutase-like phosphatase (HAD superfamily)